MIPDIANNREIASCAARNYAKDSSHWVFDALLKVFSFYIISGNLFRAISFGFEHNLLITEFILYSFVFSSSFFLRLYTSVVYLFISVVFLSSLYGSILHGIHGSSVLFAIRMIGMIFSGYIIGRVLFIRFGLSISEVLKYFERAYFKNLVAGFLIFIIFPKSTEFWIFLSKLGLVFQGDPHRGRFISTYLDPNYFGAICCIPFIISYEISRNRSDKKWNWKGMLFALGILLTWSRSGIGTFFVFLFGILIVRVLKISHHHFRVRTIILPLLCFWFLLGVFFLFSDSILFFLNRLIYMKSDASALGRLTSFMWGWDLFLEHPILGVGYNYLALYLQDFSGFSSVDSSILATFITFGLIVSFLFLFWVAVWSICIFRRIKIIERDHSQISSFFRLIYFYVIICFVFTCHFNNLLYYQFWFIPVTVIFSYLSCCIQKIEDLKSKPWKRGPIRRYFTLF